MSVAPRIYDICCSPNKITLLVAQNPVACCSKFRCPLLKILLPVALNFVARRFSRRCPSFFQALPVVFHAVARGFFKRCPKCRLVFSDSLPRKLFTSGGNNRAEKAVLFKDRTSNQKYALVYLQKKPFLCILKQKA